MCGEYKREYTSLINQEGVNFVATFCAGNGPLELLPPILRDTSLTYTEKVVLAVIVQICWTLRGRKFPARCEEFTEYLLISAHDYYHAMRKLEKLGRIATEEYTLENGNKEIVVDFKSYGTYEKYKG